MRAALFFMMTLVTTAKVIELTAENFEHEVTHSQDSNSYTSRSTSIIPNVTPII